MNPVQFRVFLFPNRHKFNDPSVFVPAECENLRIKLAARGVKVENYEVSTFQEYQSYICLTGYFVSFEAVCVNPINIRNTYDHLKTIWSQVTEEYDKEHAPLLVLSGKCAFPRFHAQQHANVHYNLISFGVMPYPGSHVCYKSISYPTVEVINFYHDIRTIEIKLFSVHAEKFKLTILYKFIRSIFVCYTDSSVKLFLDLLHPPILHKESIRRSRFVMASNIVSNRILSVPSLGLDQQLIGKANILMLELTKKREAFEIISRLHYRCNLIDINYGNIKSVFSSPPSCNIVFPYFSCNYLLAAITNRNFVVAQQCSSADYVANSSFSKFKEKPLEKALSTLLFNLDFGKFFHFYRALASLYEYYSDHKEEDSFSHYIVPERSRLIRRIVITPTRYLLYPPEVMFENRVLRNFDSEFAVRVSFRDDNMSRLSFNSAYTEDAVYNSAIKHPMLNGLTFGNRHYEFLAWSNSQIRDHGVWMYACDTKGFTSADIRRWMGNFSHIRSVSKYMSRMGQCFSQTVETISVPLEQKHIRIEKDIELGYDYSTSKPYCFSDGIGRISESLAKQVRNAYGEHKYCSAFQIRYGGCKGMLVVDPNLTDTDIVFRESMVKFESASNTNLEIAKVSSPIKLQLNRPFITLLNGLGLKPPIFLQMQENMLSTLTEMLLMEDKAAEYLLFQSTSNVFKFKELSASGIGLTVEPFFRSMLLALHSHYVEMIKTRANVAIDPKEGRNMFGVLDETGLLHYGQVFIQYTNDISFGQTTHDTTVVKGTVVVTKNPCMHPGDVRKFMAVDIPALHHIVDCIVFPQNGPRPHPNEMSGSDLDGDEYAVIWKKDLIFYRDNFPASAYPAHTAPPKSSISVEDMIDFLVEYIKNDQIGAIANAHLAAADKEGIFSKKCIQIAEKFSIAVDYAKNGTKAELQHVDRPEMFPDFMEKSHKKTYKSEKALGKMFRICKDFEDESQKKASTSYERVQVDPALVYPGWEHFEKEAIESREKYNRLLYIVFQTYGVMSEAEAFSGAFSQFHYRFQERKDKEEVEKIVIGCLKALCKNMKNEFMIGYEEGDSLLCERLLQKASAWYVVTYRDPHVFFLSFPWIVSNFLASVRLKTLAIPITLSWSPLLTNLNLKIWEGVDMAKFQQLPLAFSNRIYKMHVFCNHDIIIAALRVMIQWAIDMEVIQDPGYGRRKGFMFLDRFVNLFLYVASLENYLLFEGNNSERVKNKHDYSPAALCLAFLKFCMKLRFCNKTQANELVPFDVYKYKWLAKRAISSYHTLAITGTFSVLSFESPELDDLCEMKTEYIEISAVSSSGILNEQILDDCMKRMVEYSGAEYVSLREVRNIKQVKVDAIGTAKSLNILKGMIRKDPSTLRSLLFSSV